VNSARAVFARLQKWNEENGGQADVILLTGRSRPLDRERLIQKFWERICAGRARNAEDRPIFVVATQCIEAGANLDFDALVTEIASLDALRQRFGRVDRLGELNTSQAWIVARADHAQYGDDAIYGLAVKETFKFLEQPNRGSGKRKNVPRNQSINFGINSLATKLPADLAPYITPPKNAPTLMPAHLDYFAQTNPCPAPDPYPAIFLHGPDTEPADVKIVWRADLPKIIEEWAEILSLLPPTSAEALSLPIYTVTKWLHAGGESDLTDVEGALDPEERSKLADGLRHLALIWRGKKKKPVFITSAAEIKHVRPGDTLVIQASAGGLDEFGWNQEGTEAVRDVADIALSKQRGRANLRLHPAVVSSWFELAGDRDQEKQEDLVQMIRRLHQSADDDLATEATSSEIPTILQFIRDAEWVRQEIRDIAQKADIGRIAYPNDTGWICSGRKDPSNLPIFLREEDDASTLEEARSLDAHVEDVTEVLESWLPHLPIPSHILKVLSSFPRLHDIGKADPRFQDFLYGGNLESLGESLRAKSEDENLTKEQFDERWAACGLPSGWRHELCSLDILQQNPQLLNGFDDDQKALLKHSIGSHHGLGRILPPIIENSDSPRINQRFSAVDCQLTCRHDWHRLDSGWIDQFAKLQFHFGWYGLAYIEAIVRLADHVASAKLNQS
jgi:CRISPR-associated endonuclease/helicase Cas3